MVRRLPGNGSPAGQRDAGTAAPAAQQDTTSDGLGALPLATGEAAADNPQEQKRRKAKDGAVAPEEPAEMVQAQADAPSAAQPGVDPMQDAVRSRQRRKRADSDRQPDGGAHPLRHDAAATDASKLPPDAATALAEAGTLRQANDGSDDPVQKRSRKRKQQQAASTHSGERKTATEAQLATAATDDPDETDAAEAGAVSPAHATQQSDKDGGHVEQQPKRRRNKGTIEQPPDSLAPGPNRLGAALPPAPESGRTGDSEAPGEQPKKRRRRDIAEQPRQRPASAPQPQMVGGAAATADPEQAGRTDADQTPAKQPKGRKKAKAAIQASAAANGSHDVPTTGEASAPAAAEGQPSAHREANGGAVRAAGAGVAIHGDGPAWREHAARNDVRTGRYSESEKQTIRDAVALCALA